MQFFIIFFQRLFSKPGQAEVKAAYLELGQVLTGGAALYAALRAKDFGAIEAQLPLFGVAAMAFFTAVRSIFSSNVKAVANPKLPNIVGDGSMPINVPQLTTDPQGKPIPFV